MCVCVLQLCCGVQSSDSLQSGMDNHSRPGDILPAFGMMKI